MQRAEAAVVEAVIDGIATSTWTEDNCQLLVPEGEIAKQLPVWSSSSWRRLTLITSSAVVEIRKVIESNAVW